MTGSARAARTMWRDLLALAGPRTWWLPVVACLAGALAGGGSVTIALVLGLVWLSLPYGLLRGGLEALVRGDVPADAIRLAIAVTNLPLLAVLVLVGGASVGLAVATLLAVGVALAWPPIRLADRPAADLAGEGFLPVLAVLVGMLLTVRPGADSGAIPWIGLIAAWAWAVSHVALGAAGATASTGPTRLTGTERAVGTRGLAIVALAGIAGSAGLAATLGTVGLLAGIGIAVLGLLPAMLLARSTPEPVRAESPGLLALVGAWLGVLLLHERGVVSVEPRTIAVAVPAAIAGYALMSIVVTRIATWRHRVRRRAGDDTELDVPSVTIVVASHDRIVDLPTVLAAARSQTYADSTVLAVDAGSTDDSVAEAAAWLGADAVLEAGAAPSGWSPRDWAWHAGATAATSDLLLLVDGGTVLAPIATRILVEQAVSRRLDLLSGVLRHAMPTTGERAGTPGIPLVLFGLVPIWWSAVTHGRPPSVAFAHDGFVLVRRDAYLGVGDDTTPREGGAPALARAIARTGGRIGTVHAARLGTTRPRARPDGAVAAWRREFLPMVAGRLAPALVALTVAILGFLVPLALPPAAILQGVRLDGVLAASVPLVLLMLARVALIVTQHHPLRTIVWHPVTIGLLVVGQAAAIVDHVRGPRRADLAVPPDASAADLGEGPMAPRSGWTTGPGEEDHEAAGAAAPEPPHRGTVAPSRSSRPRRRHR